MNEHAAAVALWKRLTRLFNCGVRAYSSSSILSCDPIGSFPRGSRLVTCLALFPIRETIEDFAHSLNSSITVVCRAQYASSRGRRITDSAQLPCLLKGNPRSFRRVTSNIHRSFIIYCSTTRKFFRLFHPRNGKIC